MNLKSLFDTIESFAVGLGIFIVVMAIIFVVFFASALVPNILVALNALFYLLLLIVLIVAFIFVIYFIGRTAKKPIKNKINSKVTSNFGDHVYCENCGSKLKYGAKFCDCCGTRLNR